MTDAKSQILGRKRKVDLENLAVDAADHLAQQIGERIGKDVNELCEKTRKSLKIYGLDIKLTYIIHQIGEDPLAEYPELKKKAAPKRRRKIKS